MAVLTSRDSPATSRRRARIRFSVSVPVLSVQMTVAEPKRFDGWQMAHERTPGGHPLSAHRHREGQRRQQTFRHVRDDQPDGKHEVVPERQIQCTTDHEQRSAEQRGEQGDQSTETPDLTLQGRGPLRCRLRQMRDVSELRPHAGGDDDRESLTGRDRGAREHHVALLGAGVMRGLQVGTGIAATRDRFTRQGGVINPHVERLDQAAVRGHLIAFGQRDHIARNQGW